jgi:transposase-like protein
MRKGHFMSVEISIAEKKWVERIKQQRDSGQSQGIWCSENGLSRNTLQYWIKKLGMQQSVSTPHKKFAKVTVPLEPRKSLEQEAKPTDGLTIKLQNISFKIPEGYAVQDIREFIAEILGQ